jgi:Mn2+/Fe2+ NRAMP family transporter
MLAACTIGPGTVVVCSKAGAEFDLALIWTLVVASFVAYTLAESAARLAIVSGMSFGRAIRKRFGSNNSIPMVAYVALGGVLVGNIFYEANCMVGGLAALYVIYQNVAWFRWLIACLTGGFTLLALFKGDVDQIGQVLGVVVILMGIVFGVTAETIEVATHQIGGGFVPSIPSGSADTVLSMMATTAIPFNVFLAASMTEGSANLPQMKRGIAFASTLTCIISILIVIVGSGIESEEDFTVEGLGEQIGISVGDTAKDLFCIGLYAAAFSSMITVALGAALCAQQIFEEEQARDERSFASGALNPNSGALSGAVSGALDIEARKSAPLLLHVHGSNRTNPTIDTLEGDTPHSPDGTTGVSALVDGSAAAAAAHGQLDDGTAAGYEPARNPWDSNGWRFNGIMIMIVGISVIVGGSNADTVTVITLAQVVNGILLPFLAACLYLCMNDRSMMPAPTRCESASLLFSVLITVRPHSPYLVYHTHRIPLPSSFSSRGMS